MSWKPKFLKQKNSNFLLKSKKKSPVYDLKVISANLNMYYVYASVSMFGYVSYFLKLLSVTLRLFRIPDWEWALGKLNELLFSLTLIGDANCSLQIDSSQCSGGWHPELVTDCWLLNCRLCFARNFSLFPEVVLSGLDWFVI